MSGMRSSVFSGIEQHAGLRLLTEHWTVMRDEYQAIAADAAPWHEQGLHNGKWSTYGLFFAGKPTSGAPRCPQTAAVLGRVPGLFMAGFSVLAAGCVIKPHKGYTDEVLRAHLGLVCPPEAWLKVDTEVHHWREGELVVFDDTRMHSAANPSSHDRVVLLLDFFRPS